MTGTRQTGPSCAWAAWLASFRCLGNALQRSGEPILGFFVRQRLQNSVRSSRGGETLTPPSSSPAPLSHGNNARKNSPEGRPLECAALNKDHVSRIGPSHLMFACAYLFVSIRVPFAPAGGGQIMRETKKQKPSRWVLEVWLCGISTVFEMNTSTRAQPTASQMPVQG